jgi:hypothetical protein
MITGSFLLTELALSEGDSSFFDFKSSDSKFNTDYNNFKKLAPFHEQERYINSLYPEFDEEGGFLTVISEIISEFYDLFHVRESEAEVYCDDDFEFSFAYISRKKQAQIESKIVSYLKDTYNNLHISNLDEIINKFLDYTLVDNFLSARENDALYGDDISTGISESKECFVSWGIYSRDEVTLGEYDYELNYLQEVLEGIEQTHLKFLLSHNNVYLETVTFDFLQKVYRYILYGSEINGTSTIGIAYSIVILSEDLKAEFSEFIEDNDDIEYTYFTLDDNSVWEDDDN